jgi:PhnB protein
MRLNTYLNFGGNCEAALKFYEEHLGGKITSIVPYSQMPPGPENPPIPPGYENALMHARITFGGTELFASDVPPDRFQPMRSAYLTLSVDSSPEAERIYALLTEGGEIFMKMDETFFAHRFAMFRDRFGVSWMLIHEKVMH